MHASAEASPIQRDLGVAAITNGGRSGKEFVKADTFSSEMLSMMAKVIIPVASTTEFDFTADLTDDLEQVTSNDQPWLQDLRR